MYLHKQPVSELYAFLAVFRLDRLFEYCSFLTDSSVEMREHQTAVTGMSTSHENATAPLNASLNNTTDTQRLSYNISHAVLIIAYSSLIIVSVAGNGIVILSVITCRRMRTVTNYFIVSLADTTTTTTTISLLLLFYRKLFHRKSGRS